MHRSLTLVGILAAASVPPARGQAPPAVASFAGVVVDSAQHPVNNADVELPGLSLKTTTSDRGLFRFSDIAAGIHRVTVRRIGYASLDTLIVFLAGQSVDRRITLGAKIVTLDSIV